MSLEVKVYQKEHTASFFKLLKASLKDIYSSRFLAKQLAVRDIKAQYRQSYLGILWAFIAPLATAFVWIILNKSGTVRLMDTGMPYPLYAFSGTLIWSILVEAINSPITNTSASKSILSKINFPKEALIISGIYKLLFNSLIKIILLLFFVFFYGVGFNWSLLLFLPALLCVVFFGTMLGLFLTPLGMLYKDVGSFIKMGLTYLMYVTPVVYSIPEKGMFKSLMVSNPCTAMIETTRAFIIGQHPEYFNYFMALVIVGIPLLLLGLLFYRISIPIIVERTSG